MMRKQRTFRPTGDRLESRDVPASFGLASRIAPVPHATLASRLNVPFAHTLHLNIGTVGRQLSFNRTANAGAGALNNLNNLALNRLGTTLGFNLGASQANNLTVNQLRSVLNQLSSGAPLGNGALLTNLLSANFNNPNLAAVVGNNTTLRNLLRTNINNPNLASILTRANNTSLLNSGLNFPASFSGTGLGNGFGQNSLLGGSLFGNTNMLSTGTQGFVSFQ